MSRCHVSLTGIAVPAAGALLLCVSALGLGILGVATLVGGDPIAIAPLATPDCPIGIIDTVAGGATGDGGPATEATLYAPCGVAVGRDGSLYIADREGCRIRKVDPAGRIATVAGNDARDYGGEGGRATTVGLEDPTDVAVAADGTLYIAETGCHRIRKVGLNGTITTIAGEGDPGYGGDGGPAVRAYLFSATGIAVGPAGSIYIADRYNHAIRRIDPAGIISTVAGMEAVWEHEPPPFGLVLPDSGGPGYQGDGGPATSALLASPHDVAVGRDGSVYIADAGNHRVRRIDVTGIITTIAGGGDPADGLGDEGLATAARLHYPQGVAVGADGSIYVADTEANRIRKIDRAGVITTVAGSGKMESSGGYAGDGGDATSALLGHPEGVAADAHGNLYIADTLNHRVRKVDRRGIITTVVGGALGDGRPAREASLYDPTGIAVGPDGSLYLSESDENRVRRIDTHGIIMTVVGNGKPGFSGDGGPATKASLSHPRGIAVGPDGSIYVADCDNHRVRKVDGVGVITTVAGSGTDSYSGDGGPARGAGLCRPVSVAVGPDGSLYIADTGNRRVRKVDAGGIITTVAGTGNAGHSGDGGQAVRAELSEPCAVSLGGDGSLYITDRWNHRIRMVDPAGVITTVAGNGERGFSGDGGPAVAAKLSWDEVESLAVGRDGSIWIPDERNHRIRKVVPMSGALLVDDGDVILDGPVAPSVGMIHTAAGTGERDPWGDGGRATQAGLCYPNGVALGGDGTLYIADTGNHRVRRIRWRPCQPEAAKAVADELSGKAGDSPVAWREVAELYSIAQAWDQAAAAAERMLEIAPETTTMTRLRAELIAGRAYAAKRDHHAARRRLIPILARSNSPAVLREAAEVLVDLYLLRGEREQAIATLNDLRLRTKDRGLLNWIDQRLKEIAGD